MASYPVHIATSTVLGAAYGTAAILQWPTLDWGTVFLGAGLTAVGGMVPDLDSDSGVPIREMFGFAAGVVPMLAIEHVHLEQSHAPSAEQRLALMAGMYVLIRYVLADMFKRFTVHRGMFHSIPGLLICGLTIFLVHPSPDQSKRLFLGVGIMLGFLSHLVLDEIYSVDLNGVKIQLKSSAGTALKLYSSSWLATTMTYLILAGLGYVAFLRWE